MNDLNRALLAQIIDPVSGKVERSNQEVLDAVLVLAVSVVYAGARDKGAGLELLADDFVREFRSSLFEAAGRYWESMN